MERKIVAYKHYFKEFFEQLDYETQDKLLYVLTLLKTQDRLPIKFIKFIQDGLFELRMEYNGNIYRLFFIFEKGYIVILFNGFQKKTTNRELWNELYIKVKTIILILLKRLLITEAMIHTMDLYNTKMEYIQQ